MQNMEDFNSKTSRELTPNDLNAIDGESRILDGILGARLGFERPRKVRELIRRNKAELARYGDLPMITKIIRGSNTDRYWLNEAQALLICIKSDTENAADVREEVIKVFLAYRRGEIDPTKEDVLVARIDALTRSLAAMESRVAGFAAALNIHATLDTPEYGRAVTYLPIFGLKAQRRPTWWSCEVIREIITSAHRQMTINEVVERCRAAMPEMEISRSSIHRYWQKLDALRALVTPKKLLN